MAHKAKSPDGLDATKLGKSNGGANVEKQCDGWYDTVIDGILTRTVQKMQNASGVQLGLLRSQFLGNAGSIVRRIRMDSTILMG